MTIQAMCMFEAVFMSFFPYFVSALLRVDSLRGGLAAQVLRAYPEKIGAEAPEQPQNSRQSQKRGIFLSALALAAGGWRKTGRRDRTAAGRLRHHRITTQLLQRRYPSENFFHINLSREK